MLKKTLFNHLLDILANGIIIIAVFWFVFIYLIIAFGIKEQLAIEYSVKLCLGLFTLKAINKILQ